MNHELEEKLYKEFPNLYKGRTLTIQQSLMPFGFQCDDGWFKLIWQLSEKLSKIDPTCEASEVKEKYAILCFYVNGTTAAGWKVIEKAEKDSATTCEECGTRKTAKIRVYHGWFYCRCLKCWSKLKKQCQNKLRKLKEGKH